MQMKINVLDDLAIAAGVREAYVAKLEALADRARRRDGICRCGNCGFHGQEIEKVLKENGLFRNVVKSGKDLLNVGPGAVEGAGQKREAAQGHGARERPR